ncbi:hypothetical protein DM860_000628 [Cuscuta australis]|uniref:Phospholipase D n=1 Tax=Cuscuta australis TaxID=267555 RepID=A0A328CXD7_9ASTE|nr:hypothetical protein DM860_000628 [Cuscuta australis]
MEAQLLHGTLFATIYEVDRIPSGFCPTRCCVGFPQIGSDRFYATIDLDKARVGRTQLTTTSKPCFSSALHKQNRAPKKKPSNPTWNQDFRIYCAHKVSHVIFTVKYDDPVGAKLVGRARLWAAELMAPARKGAVVDRWLPILDGDGSPVRGNSRIHVRLKFSSVEDDEQWSKGILKPGFNGVPDTYFDQRENCQVTLYADAHSLSDEKIGGKLPPGRCWEDIFEAIQSAKHLIYIAGWSIYAKIRLVRDPARQKADGDMILGDLLKRKAGEGVKVLLLVWDDRTSDEFFKKRGVMATHDEETASFFRGSGVRCLLCPRNFSSAVAQGVQASARTTLFTHHQKTVIADYGFLQDDGGEKKEQKRGIVSFLGGIDLCDGRYDTQEHSLFRKLDKDDFHQPNFAGASYRKGGPREPWHDIHCRLEGEAAWDVLYNFEQRWKKAEKNAWQSRTTGTVSETGRGSGNMNLSKFSKFYKGFGNRAQKDVSGTGNRADRKDETAMFSLEELRRFTVPPSSIPANPNDPERWSVQIFRSIDGNDAADFPEDPREARKCGLVTGKSNITDRSIQDAYINAIRRAKNFIYIENQYFVGSSYGWGRDGDNATGALHLVPKEISLKIASKIEAKERFTAYVVIPMWPEGVPESESVQAILDWQRRTMEMMYTDIAEALKAHNVSADPREYLTFFCLGNREVRDSDEYTPPEKPDSGTNYARAQQSRRFMIYVHSKLMIVDDDYIIIGSANINQRSMDGSRDSEIAMGGYQSMHLTHDNQPARGKIFDFRMALWGEHTSRVEDLFSHPEHPKCIQRVNAIAEENWRFYVSDAEPLLEDIPGHLLTYPIQISEEGKVGARPGFENFPDTKARVLGTRSTYLPPILTT